MTSATNEGPLYLNGEGMRRVPKQKYLGLPIAHRVIWHRVVDGSPTLCRRLLLKLANYVGPRDA